MEFQTSGLNLKNTSCNEVSGFFIGVAKWKCVIFGLCPRLFLVKLFAQNGAFYAMKVNGLKGYETVFIFEVGFKADLTSKMEIGNGVFPDFYRD